MWLACVLWVLWGGMAIIENFNDGASLVAKGWKNVNGNILNKAGAGPDGSFALDFTDGAGAPGNALQPVTDPCPNGTGMRITFPFNRRLAGGGFFLNIEHDDYTAIHPLGNPEILVVSFASSFGALAGQVFSAGGFNQTNIPNFWPAVGSGYKVGRIEIDFSTGWDEGTEWFTTDGAFRWYYGDDENSLTLIHEITNVAIGNPTVHPTSPTTERFNGFRWRPFGGIDDIDLEGVGCEEEEEPDPDVFVEPEDVSDPCCGSGTGESTFGGGPGVTGDIPVVDPNQPYRTPSTTTCVGGGQPPEADDPTEDEDWRTLQGATPDVFCELIATKHPSSLGSTTYRWADKPLDVPVDAAFAEGRVRRGGWLEIRRAMALPDQYPEISRAGVTIDESDALIRTLKDSDATAYLLGREFIEWLVSEQGRKAASAVLRPIFHGVLADVNPGDGRTYRLEAQDLLTSPFGVFDQDKLVPQALMDHTFFGPGRATYPWNGQPSAGLHKDLVGKPIPIIGGAQTDRGAVASDGRSAEKGAVPLIWTGDVFAPGHGDQIWGELLVCLGAVKSIEDVFMSDVGYDGLTPADPPRPPRRMKLTEAFGGRDVLVPGWPGWPFETDYIERTVNGQTLRYTAIYARGPRMTHHRKRLCTAAANVCGPEHVGDGSGTMMDQFASLAIWFYNEHVCKNQGKGYRSGNWWPLETWPSDSTLPYLKVSAFLLFQEYSKVKLKNTVGYKCGFQLRERVTLREIDRRFMQDFEVSFPFTSFGQRTCIWINDLADADDGTHYRERIEIDEPLPPYRDAHDQVQNRDAVQYDYDHDLQQWRREPETFEDAASIEAHLGASDGGKRLSDGEPVTPREIWMTADPDTVRDAVSRRRIRKRVAPRYQDVPSDLGALHDDIGSQIRITHSRGVGTSGYQARAFLVLGQRHNPNRHTVTLEAFDLGRILQSAAPALGEKNASEGGFILRDKASTQPPPVGAYELR